MSAYTISKLAESAGVSVHVARDYITRGLLHPARRTESGYGIFDDEALKRLRFVRMASQAGIGLSELGRLCHAVDNRVVDAGERLDHLRLLVAARREALALLDRHLATMALAASPRAEAGCAYA